MGRSFFGASCIVLSTVLSNNINHEILSPIVFSVGILLVVGFNLGLITRSVPGGDSFTDCFITLATNIMTAMCFGLLLRNTGTYPETLEASIGGAIVTGIVIGLVSVSNKFNSRYAEWITMILMFSFVYLHLPHCMVYAFYFGTLPMITMQELGTLALVTVGNILGGLIVRYSMKILNVTVKVDNFDI